YLYQTSHTAIYTLSLHDALPISQLLDMVAIQVSERHVEAAVRDAFPSFVDGNDVLSRVVLDVNLLLDRNLLRADECHRDRHADQIGRAHAELQSLAYLVCRLLLE